LRADKKSVPVLVLTARADISSKVSALDLGADDYLAKPFDMAELVARMRAITRRMGAAVSSNLEYGEVVLDIAAHVLNVGEVVMDISPREFAILRDLLQNIGRVRTRASLEEAIYSWDKEVSSNAIEVHLSHLRKKLPKNFIKTIRGVGYTINTQRG
jgi:DNA-binding response OmpR family regulator